MARIKLSGIVSVTFYILFQLVGCTSTPSPIKEKKLTSYTLPNSSPNSQISKREKANYSKNLEQLTTYPPKTLNQLKDSPNLQFLSSSNSLSDFTEYASTIHKLTGKGVFHTDFPLTVNRVVKEFIYYFQKEEEFTKKSLKRSKLYLPLLKSIFKENNLPEDLVFLAFIESGFNPYAYSRSGACGIWQFMRSTAKRYGLQVDLWVDERRDPEKSTRAAAKYLKDLYSKFGDWYLAVTAYNAGEQKVAQAIKKYKTTEYWSLRNKPYLKLESRNFVPKLLAAILIAKNPEKYGFGKLEFQEPTELTTVQIPNPIDLKFIAKMAGISCLLYTSPSPRDLSTSRMPSSA